MTPCQAIGPGSGVFFCPFRVFRFQKNSILSRISPMKNLSSRIVIASFVVAVLGLSACDPNYNNGSSWYPQNDPPRGYGYDRPYGNGYGNGNGYGYGNDNKCNRDKCSRNRCNSGRCSRDHDDRPRPTPRPPAYSPPPPPPPREEVIRPSCPSGTSFDGKHCIVPEGQRRKGGKGTINACPSGMYLSGDRCVRN